MNALTELLRTAEAQALGWTLLHFLWQGALLAAAHALARAALRRHSANARYLAGCLTLALMAAAAMLTWGQLREASGQPEGLARLPAVPLIGPASTAPALAIEPHATGVVESLNQVAEASLPWLTAAWLAGVGVLSLRLMGSWWRVRRLQRAPGLPLEGRLGARLFTLQARLRVSRPVRLMQSAVVRVPTVVGWLRPAILLPASTLTGLSPLQLDFILAHELAHIRRGDCWANLLQVLLETVLFYHPAVWWVSRCVREEREHCCDDLALAACGDGVAGARALATLEELRQPPPRLALAASGGSLLGRVKRLLGMPAEDADWRRPLGNALVGLGLVLMIAGAIAFGGPSRYEATARIAIEGPPATDSFDPNFLRTAMARFTSEEILVPVIKRLGLASKWGAGGQALAPAEVLDRLQSRLQVRFYRGTSLCGVVASTPTAAEARDIANAVAESYRDWHLEQHRRRANSGVQALERSLAEQNVRVSAVELRLAQVRQQTTAMLDATHGQPATLTVNSNLASLFAQVESQLLLHEGQREALRGLDSQDLLHALTTILPGETVLPQLQLSLAEAEQTLARLRVDYASDHPEVREATALGETIERQIAERMQGVLAGLDNLIQVEKAQRDVLLKKLAEQRQELAGDLQRQMESSELSREIEPLTRDLENEQRIRDSLALRLMQEKLDAQAPNKSPVELVDAADLPLRPVRSAPAVGGAIFGSGAISLLTGLTLRMAGRRPTRAPRTV